MKPLKTPRVIPETRQYWKTQLEGKGDHHFKHPYYGIGTSVLSLSAKYHVDPETDKRGIQEKAVSMLPFAGAVIGVCWRHRGLDLETVYPMNSVTPEALEEYGIKVIEELQDSDYDLLEIIDLFGSVMPEFIKRQSLVEMASARASFTEPPKEGSISSSSN